MAPTDRDPIEEHRPVDLIAPDGSIVAGKFLVRELADGPDSVELTLALPDRRFVAASVDAFEALIQIRREIEPLGMKVLCWGACLHVYPSEMSRSMGIGDSAYRLTLGQFARAADRVSIFDSGPGLVAATVAEQEEFPRAWFDSLADLP